MMTMMMKRKGNKKNRKNKSKKQNHAKNGHTRDKWTQNSERGMGSDQTERDN